RWNRKPSRESKSLEPRAEGFASFESADPYLDSSTTCSARGRSIRPPVLAGNARSGTGPRLAEPSHQGQRYLGEGRAVAHQGVCAVGCEGHIVEWRHLILQPRFPCDYYAMGQSLFARCI